MGLKSYLTELLRLDKREEGLKEEFKQASEMASVKAIEEFFQMGLNIKIQPAYQPLVTMPYWSFSFKEHARDWIQRRIVDQIKENYSTLARATVERVADDYFRSDEFLDRMIERINRKQIRAGTPIESPSSAQGKG